jgi:hypothetical protein
MTINVYHSGADFRNETIINTTDNTNRLEALLIETVGPKTFHLHHTVGGPGWCILNTAKTIKTVVIDDPQLATFVILKLK